MKFCLTFIIALAFSASAQTYQPTILQHTFDSEVFGAERTISISLPTGYAESDSTINYPVAYLFDGQFNPYFAMVSSVMDYYSQIGEGLPMIVVSIHTTNRSLEFTPKWNHQETFDGWRGNCGSADVLTSSLKNEIIPFIEGKYRTGKYRLGVGHSLGGTYVMQEIFNDESIFDGVIAVSPNLNYDEEQIVEQGKQFFQKTPQPDPFIYASAGDQGSMESSFRRSLQKLDSIHNKLVSGPNNWECNWLDGDGHMSAFLPTFNYAYLSFSKHWTLSDDQLEIFARNSETFLENIDAFYENLSVFAGESIKPTVDDFNNFGYSLSYFGKYEQAIETFEEGIKRFPEDPNLHDSKGEMLEELGNYVAAKKSYETGLALLKKNPSYYPKDSYDYYLDLITKNINRLSDDYIEYKALIQTATVLFADGKHTKASKQFEKAFKLDIIRATHMDRKMAVSCFAQAGKFDAAFAQLDLLANKFEWQGRTAFEEDESMKALNSDERWEKYMKIMDQNELNAE